MVSEDDVVWAYRELLGRDPESAAIVRAHCEAHADWKALVKDFIGSGEFLQSRASVSQDDVIWTYRKLLGRDPCPTQVRDHCRSQADWKALVSGLVASPEFRRTVILLSRAAPSLKLVVCSGLFRSGSTWLFNVVRKLLVDGFQSLFSDGAGCSILSDGQSRTIIVKCHKPEWSLLEVVGRTHCPVLLTIRDPRDAVVSLMSFRKLDFGEALEVIGSSADRLLDIKESATLTLKYEDRFFDSPDSIAVIGKALGVSLSHEQCAAYCQDFTREAVDEQIRRLHGAGILRDDAGAAEAFDPETHWHAGHIGDGRVGKFRDQLTAKQIGSVVQRTLGFCERFGYDLVDTADGG